MNLGIPELLIILLIALILFGPGKISGLGAALGKTFREFKRESSSQTDETKDSKSDRK